MSREKSGHIQTHIQLAPAVLFICLKKGEEKDRKFSKRKDSGKRSRRGVVRVSCGSSVSPVPE